MFVKKTMDDLDRKPAQEARRSQKQPLLIILDEVRSMHNVGSVFRTADAFAVQEMFLCGYTPVPPHREIHKTALGATETVAWKHFDNTKSAVQEARENGYKIFAVEQAHNSISLPAFGWQQEPTALIFGNEVEGVNDEILKLVDGVIEIPQWGAKHSLNISVSVGVVLWELVRQTSKS